VRSSIELKLIATEVEFRGSDSLVRQRVVVLHSLPTFFSQATFVLLPQPKSNDTMAMPFDSYESLTSGDRLADIEMSGESPIIEIATVRALAATDEGDAGEDTEENDLPFPDEVMELADASARVTYVDYLKSPVIGLLVGQGDEQALLTAHQALLTTSPWFADACSKFSDEVSACRFDLG
jgi:hypothetical protein